MDKVLIWYGCFRPCGIKKYQKSLGKREDTKKPIELDRIGKDRKRDPFWWNHQS